jgi:hypothetical protein
MKNRTLAAFALAGLIGFAACGGGEEAATDDTLLEDTTTMPPVTPAPVVTDSAMMPMDSAAMDTAVAPM